ncbi:MAG: 4-hydroxy-tetrahydrodipicolinate reductase [Actinomycetota bacterium]|nr:4-hydroxy-tetrahydrodipicolinate reductase [Actinomycetota bacterium]
MLRVGVIGAGGRMGATVCDAVTADPDTELVAAVDPSATGRTAAGVEIVGTVNELVATGVDVVVDFTVADAARENLPSLGYAGIDVVVGTSGLTAGDLAALEADFGESTCLVVSNFAIGAVLMQRFAELAAPWFETAEIIELHHDRKVDAPSGTALATAQRMAAASSDWAPDPTKRETVAGARGAAAEDGIRVHSVRMRGLVAHQEVILGAEGQTLTIRHDSYDRSSFMAGVLVAAKGIGGLDNGVREGLDELLGL